jgi:SAM-dependent methyltransferase
MTVLPPGTVLQHLYLRERLGRILPGRFVEIGPGRGDMTQLLLDRGWTGVVYDLSAETIQHIEHRFAEEISGGRLGAVTGDFVAAAAPVSSFDLVISCMVMEHLDAAAEARFMATSAAHLGAGGMMIGLVPASPRHWGIEDRISGHYRRYDRRSLRALMARSGWRVRHIAGLTFPLSNLLLPLSDFLTRRAESGRLRMSMQQRTRLSGRRTVQFKTQFPAAFGWVLNERSMRPLHWLQKQFLDSDNAMVLYFEAEPSGGAAAGI